MKNPAARHFMKIGPFSFLFASILSTALAFKDFADKPACAISLAKLNVFYIGVDNPVTIIVRGVPAEQVVASAKGLTIQKKDGDDYSIQAGTPGESSITVSGGNMPPATFKYRVKRIPDPVPLLGAQHRSGSIGNGAFKAAEGIAAILENFDFDARCEVAGYEITRLAKQEDAVTMKNSGARFNSQAKDLVFKAKPGDSYFFDDIKVLCPGDAAARNVGGLAFRIR
ncbi:MAG: GldM family protein [Saprospiraceae bacterium]